MNSSFLQKTIILVVGTGQGRLLEEFLSKVGLQRGAAKRHRRYDKFSNRVSLLQYLLLANHNQIIKYFVDERMNA